MSEYLVIVSFDLSNATSDNYKCFYEELKTLGLSRNLQRKNGSFSILPTTTTVGGKIKYKDGDSLFDYLSGQIKQVFKRCKVNGEFFLLITKSWVWNINKVVDYQKINL